MPITIQPKRPLSRGATRMVGVSYEKWLDKLTTAVDAELTGTPTVVEIDTAELTIDNEAINVATLEIDDADVEEGKAVQFSVHAPSDCPTGTYRIRVTATSDSSPAESEPFDVLLEVV